YCSVFSFFATVHTKTMAQRRSEFYVVAGRITGRGYSGSCKGRPIGVKQIPRDQGRRHAAGDPVSQSIVLAMMDKIVMEIMIPATLQADPGVAKRRYVTVVHREGIKRSLDAIGHRKIVVIIVAGASLTERFPVMFHIPLRIGTLNPKSCDAHARTQGTDQYRCIQSIADQ